MTLFLLWLHVLSNSFTANASAESKTSLTKATHLGSSSGDPVSNDTWCTAASCVVNVTYLGNSSGDPVSNDTWCTGVEADR